MLKRFAEWWGQVKERSRQHAPSSDYTIAADAEQIILLLSSDHRPVGSLAWSEVTEVVAFKRDLFAVDQICLAIASETACIEVNEEMRGWKELITDLPAFLSGCLPTEAWHAEVMQPPFAPSPKLIFSRMSSAAG